MEHSVNSPIFNIPGTLFGNIPRNFIGNFFRIYREYIMGMFYEYSTNIYLPGGHDYFIQRIMVANDKVAPIKERRIKHNSQEWFDDEISEAIINRVTLLKKF